MAIESPKNKGRKFAIGNQLYADRKQAKTLYYLKWMVEGRSHEFYYKAGTTLKEARELAEKDLKLIKNGIDPREYRKEQEEKRLAELKAREQDERNTFEYVAELAYRHYFESGKWQGKGASRKWGYLKNHAFPAIGDKPIKDITPRDIADIINPLYKTTTSAVEKIQVVIKQVYEYALLKEEEFGLTDTPFNQRYKVLTKDARENRKKPSHHGTIDYEQISELITELLKLKSSSSLCFVLSILTATRSLAVRSVQWKDIDIEKRIWQVDPATDKIKDPDRDRKIFLSSQAVELLNRIPRISDYVFPNREDFNKALGENSLGKCITGLHFAKVKRDGIGWIDPKQLDENGNPKRGVQHAICRSTFSTWANENGYDQRAIEACMFHGKSEPYPGAYNRAEYVKAKTELLQAWADYCFKDIDFDSYLPKLPVN